MDNGFTLSSPWVEEARKIHALFSEDKDIAMTYDEADSPEIKLYIKGQDKSDAIAKILPSEKTFGNVTLKITIVPDNAEETAIDILRKAFANNPIVDDFIISDDPNGFCANHVMFRNEVVQYFNDNLNDAYGLQTALFESLARDVFINVDGVFFNTSPEDDFEIWP